MESTGKEYYSILFLTQLHRRGPGPEAARLLVDIFHKYTFTPYNFLLCFKEMIDMGLILPWL